MNSITDCPGFLCSINIMQPFLWLAACFALIASVLSTAKWNHVVGHGTRAIRIGNGYPVVSVSLVKNAIQRASTNSTTTLEVVKGKFPMFYRETVRQIRFSSPVFLGSYCTVLPVVNRPIFGNPVNAFLDLLITLTAVTVMFLLVLLVVFAHVIDIALIPRAHPHLTFFRVIDPGFFNAVFVFLAVILAPLGYKFLVFSVVSFVVFAKIILVGFPLLATSFVTAAFAIRTKCIGLFPDVKILGSFREFVAANCAALKGYVILALHVEPPFGVPSPRLLTQRWDSLFFPLIIPQKRLVLWT